MLSDAPTNGRNGAQLSRINDPFTLKERNFDFSVYVALTYVPEGELLTGFAMRSDPFYKKTFPFRRPCDFWRPGFAITVAQRRERGATLSLSDVTAVRVHGGSVVRCIRG